MLCIHRLLLHWKMTLEKFQANKWWSFWAGNTQHQTQRQSAGYHWPSHQQVRCERFVTRWTRGFIPMPQTRYVTRKLFESAIDQLFQTTLRTSCAPSRPYTLTYNTHSSQHFQMVSSSSPVVGKAWWRLSARIAKGTKPLTTWSALKRLIKALAWKEKMSSSQVHVQMLVSKCKFCDFMLCKRNTVLELICLDEIVL